MDFWIINENNKSAQCFCCYKNGPFDIFVTFKGYSQTVKSGVVAITRTTHQEANE